MGCSVSVERVESGQKKEGEGGGGTLDGSGGGLGANFRGGWYHAAGERAGRTFMFGNRSPSIPSVMVAPAERRFLELELAEWEDSGKSVAQFDVTRAALGVPAGWAFRVTGLQLVVDGSSAAGRLSDALAWVEVPNAEADRVSGLAIEALLSVTGAMPLTTERSCSAVRFGVDLPLGRMDVPMRVRAALTAGGGRPRLVASVLTAPQGPVGRGGLWESSRLFRASIAGTDEALVPLDLTCFRRSWWRFRSARSESTTWRCSWTAVS